MSDKNISLKLTELSKRAGMVRSDTRLRHVPSEHDVRLASENVRLMQSHQSQTIHDKNGDK